MVDRRDQRSSRTTRRPARASAAGRKSGGASAGRKTTSKGRAGVIRRAKPAPPKPKAAAKSARTPRGKTAGRQRVAPARAPKRHQDAKAKSVPPRTVPLPVTSAEPLVSATAALAPVAASVLAPEPAALAVPVRRRRRGPRVKFTHWLYSDELYRQLGVSPRGQALVCRELRAERDGSWSARVAAVPAGFFEATWVIVPPEVVVPVARPKRVDATH